MLSPTRLGMAKRDRSGTVLMVYWSTYKTKRRCSKNSIKTMEPCNYATMRCIVALLSFLPEREKERKMGQTPSGKKYIIKYTSPVNTSLLCAFVCSLQGPRRPRPTRNENKTILKRKTFTSFWLPVRLGKKWMENKRECVPILPLANHKDTDKKD